MNYLSIKATPETNLKIIAENPLSYTKEMAIKIQEIDSLKSSISTARLGMITSIAVGIILCIIFPLMVGGAVLLTTCISFVDWRNRNIELNSKQKELDSELENLSRIYQKMIDCVKARQELIQVLIEPNAVDLEKTRIVEESLDLTQKIDEEIDSKLLEIAKKLSEIAKIPKDPHINIIDKNNKIFTFQAIKDEKEMFSPIFKKLGDCESDFQFCTKEVKDSALKIGQSSVKVAFLKEKWKELTEICRQYSKPYDSSTTLRKDLIVDNFAF